jgi:hypothetical protein
MTIQWLAFFRPLFPMLFLFPLFSAVPRPAFPFDGEASGQVILTADTGQGEQELLLADTAFCGIGDGGQFSSTQGSFPSAMASYWESYCIAKCTCGRNASSRSMSRMKGQNI